MNYPLVAGCIAKSCASILFGENRKRDLFVYVTRVDNNQVYIIYPVFEGSLKKGAYTSSTAVFPKYLTPISPSITNPEQMSEFLGTCGMKLSDVVDALELADPTVVYPVKDRIDFNALNEGTVKYDLETLEKAAIKSNMALNYYEQIFAEFLRRETSVVEEVKKPAKATQEKSSAIKTRNGFGTVYTGKMLEEAPPPPSPFSAIDIDLEMQRIATLRKLADMNLEVNDIKSEMLLKDSEEVESTENQYLWSTTGSGTSFTIDAASGTTVSF